MLTQFEQLGADYHYYDCRHFGLVASVLAQTKFDSLGTDANLVAMVSLEAVLLLRLQHLDWVVVLDTDGDYTVCLGSKRRPPNYHRCSFAASCCFGLPPLVRCSHRLDFHQAHRLGYCGGFSD